MNVIKQAAACACRDTALSLVADALGIELETTPPDGYRWQVLDETARLVMLGDWLKAECLAEREAMLVPMVGGKSPLDAVGTND